MKQFLIMVSILLIVSITDSNGKNKFQKNYGTQYFIYFEFCKPLSDCHVDTAKLDFKKTFTDSICTLSYTYKSHMDTIIEKYILSERANFSNQYIINDGEEFIFNLKFLNTGTYSINKQDFKVYKLVNNEELIDGCVDHFWSPQFGIILMRSRKWSSYRVLAIENNRDYKYLEILIQLIMQDYNFFVGKDY